MLTRRIRILEAMAGRLVVIRRANGFQTDAGDRLYLGVLPALGESDPDSAIALLPREDIFSGEQLEKLPLRWPLDIAAIAKPTLRDPWTAIEALLGDIKRAVELSDRTLGGLLVGGRGVLGLHRGTTETLERRSGQDMVGAAITYIAPYTETWGRPED